MLYILALLLPDDTTDAFNGCYDRLCTIKWFDFCFESYFQVVNKR